MSRRILVTGGAGFIGSHLADLLIARGDHVIILDNLTTGCRAYINPAAEFIEGDVRREADLTPIFERSIDVVCHIAGQASIRLSYMNPTDDLNVNTLGTINILRQMVAHRVSRLLFASSMTIYGNPAITPTPETAPP
ncbi:MAG: NAD-dependent epimerase/dehydratase family protein, partial [Anaerolinea sp.]|nr:NAD-dependent epimerase/dehydratase family protein [Anaerolinea sp.]